MTPLQKDKFQRLITTRQFDAARKFLDQLASAGDNEAKAYRADMDITYPVTTAEKAAKGVNRVVFIMLVIVLGILVLSVVLKVTGLY